MDYDPDAKLYMVSDLDLKDFFDDPDSDDDGTLSFTAKSSNPRDVVVAAYKKNGSKVYVDVLDASNIHDFKITIGAMDKDGEKAAETVDVTVDIAAVLSQTYTVKQNPVNYNLKAVNVGYRTGIAHILRFKDATDTTTDGGLKFADALDKEFFTTDLNLVTRSTDTRGLLVEPMDKEEGTPERTRGACLVQDYWRN